MSFKNFRDRLHLHFEEMMRTSDTTNLFEVACDKDELWNLYLDSFPAGTNEIYRKRREFDCSCCRHFIKTMGNVVVIKDNKIVTLWDFDTHSPDKYQPVVGALSAFVKSHAVSDLWLTKERRIGQVSNYKMNDIVKKWDHFFLDIPDSIRCLGDIPQRKADYRDSRNVFKRSLDNLTRDAVDTVLELIAQNSLYRGAEWKAVLSTFRNYQIDYENVPENERDNWVWARVSSVSPAVARIRNTSMGTLLIDLSEGKDLDEAVRAYERVVAPANYKRPKAIFTKKMLEDAQKTVQELGYMDSLGRRFAALSDITVNNVLFSNKDSAARMSGASNPFAAMSKSVPMNPRQFSRVEEVPAERFFSEVLPTAREVELFLENRHAANMVSLIAPVNRDAQIMFKWNNGFSWAYTGNVTDSQIRENVKNAGGKVDGVLRFSIQWNDLDEFDCNDLDAHCKTPAGEHIHYRQKSAHITQGALDVDIIQPSYGKAAVENITWATKRYMRDGAYEFFVHCFSNRGGRSGFRAEIEFDGQIYRFDYNKPLHEEEKVRVATVTLKNGVFTIKENLKSELSGREVWNVNTNQFVPVTVAMFSPNYWDEQKGIGNKHYFFMLKDCINPERPNGFYNEFIKPELVKHKRVFEALGNQMAVQDIDHQLSGVGFSSTMRNDVVVRIKGATERVLRIKF